jgi:methylisocitrate lyase
VSDHSGKTRVFRELHRAGCFVMPNPWDAGSARALEALGFKAIATTSSGFAATLGKRDHEVTLDEKLAHCRSVVASVRIPVSADFEAGFATAPEEVAANVTAAISTGLAGLSIEDSTGDASDPLFPFELAVERIRASRRAIDATGTGAVLTARSEGFVVGRPDLAETIRRLRAYADAGADCLFAPWIRKSSDIKAIVDAVLPKPVNVVVGGDFTTVADLAALGVRRISIGGGLTRVAWTGFLEAAREIAGQGTFKTLGRAVSFADLDPFFSGP